MKQHWDIAKEMSLSEINGLSIWQQGRLNQEGIESVQNLAAADVPSLVIGTSFTINQIIDWIDQAILLVHASQDQVKKLGNVGLRRASNVLTATDNDERLEQLAETTKLDKNGLKMLHLALQSASNIRIVSYFWWKLSLDPTKEAIVKKATTQEVTVQEATANKLQPLKRINSTKSKTVLQTDLPVLHEAEGSTEVQSPITPLSSQTAATINDNKEGQQEEAKANPERS